MDASATTFISDSALTKPTIPLRSNAWSSTVSTRIGPEFTITHHSSRTPEIDAEHEIWHTRFALAPLVPPVWLIVLFLLPVTFMMHKFWGIGDRLAAQDQMAHFMKNLSLVGGALFISQFGAGPLSLDNRNSR